MRSKGLAQVNLLKLDRSAMITGAAAGIGRSVALRFADFGCRRMSLVDINEEGLQETQSMIRVRWPTTDIVRQTQDISEDGAPETLVETHVNHFGRLNYLVNVAGRPGGFLKSTETTEAVFDSVQSLNVRGTYFLQQAAIQRMLMHDLRDGEYAKPVGSCSKRIANPLKRRGSIVNIGSTVSQLALPRMSAV